MRRLAVVFASFMLVFGLLTIVSPAATVHAQDSGYAPDDQEAAFLDLINNYRASLGIGPLSLNYQLGAAADYHSYDMATNNYFDHYLFDGTDPATNMRNFGYGGSTTGENIAAGMASAQEVMIAWQNSPEHDAGMRNPNFTEIGVGRVYNENSHYGWYWTTTFGGGAPAPQAPADQAPVDAVPVETLNTNTATEPAPLIDPNTAQVSGNGDLSGSTTSWQEPGTITTSGNVVELPQDAVDANGRAARATGSNPVADGTGDTVIYGDINTGGVQGESIVYEEPSLTVTGGPAPVAEPVYTETTYVEPTYSEPVYSEPVYAEPVITSGQMMSETTVTNISMEDGNGRAIGG